MTNQPQAEQATLPLFEVSKDSENVRWLERYLQASGTWLAAQYLADLVQKDDRWIRALAAASDWVISGQKGYKHIEHATAAEVEHFVNSMESQAKKMFGRAERMRKNMHKAVG
ncbi:MAG TPA: hypothetical protein VLT16_00520 [Candidatus Limnocylindrales bacterium]|nr:hypothetical protein [Candidatus Limnocylindrales bacterium]